MGDVIPELLKIKAKSKIPIRFHLRIEMGDGETIPPEKAVKEVNAILKKIKEDFQIE